MALLPILSFPDPRLRTIAKPVEEVTDEIRQLAADMFETMYAAPGIGLAASLGRIVIFSLSSWICLNLKMNLWFSLTPK